jgi:hypothetical protein
VTIKISVLTGLLCRGVAPVGRRGPGMVLHHVQTFRCSRLDEPWKSLLSKYGTFS